MARRRCSKPMGDAFFTRRIVASSGYIGGRRAVCHEISCYCTSIWMATLDIHGLWAVTKELIIPFRYRHVLQYTTRNTCSRTTKSTTVLGLRLLPGVTTSDRFVNQAFSLLKQTNELVLIHQLAVHASEYLALSRESYS